MPKKRVSPLRFRVAALSTLALVLGSLVGYSPAAAQAPPSPAWGVGSVTDSEIWDLISMMTLDEETGMVHGGSDTTCADAYVSPSVQGCQGQAGYIPGVERLGIPPLRLTDGPAGIRLGHVETALPAPVGLAATFDRSTAHEFGAVMGREGRATNQDVLLAPMTNQVAIPTAGRNFETLGEDPYLMGQLLANEVTGVQGEGLIATLKHYAMNDFENGRNSTSVDIDEQSLREMELASFEEGVQAKAGAVMCAYNRVNDVYSCSNQILQNDILKDAFGFQGWVMSDWGATHRTSDMMYGLDMAMPRGTTGNGWSDSVLADAVANGTTAVPLSNDFPAVPAYSAAEWKAALDQAVFRILKQMNNAGLLEGTQYGSHYTDGTPYVPPRADLEALKPGSFDTALAVAEQSATLLRNEGNALPLTRGHFSTAKGVVVMGPTSTAPYIGGGGSANVTPYPDVVSPYAALREELGSDANMRYVPGYDLDGQVLPASAMTAPADSAFAGQHGWLRTQISTTVPPSGSEPGPCSADCAPDRLDPMVDYVGGNALPASTAWRWQGTFTAPSEGPWQLKIFVKDQSGAQLFVDGLTNSQRRINLGAYATTGGFGGSSVPSWDKLVQTSKAHDPNLDRLQQGTYSVDFAAGESHELDLRAFAGATDPLQIQFRWVPPDWQAQKIDEAVQAAASAKEVVVFAYDEGTEGRDRGIDDPAAGMVLPGYQDALISAVAEANPNTIVVLNTGDPVLTPWVDDVAAVLEMWYPGQLGGIATANVLLGKANPAGKLPVTFPVDGASYPQYDPNCTDTSADGNCPLYPGVAKLGFLGETNHSYRTIDFTTNGIFVGYRWYDERGVDPRFPFGHGLSYTQFKYSDLTVKPAAQGGGLDVGFLVRNVGPMAGSEVPQVYVGPSSTVPDGVAQAERKLVQFDRVTLASGHAAYLTLHVAPRELSYWSADQHAWVLGTGTRAVYVGSSSRDLRLQATVQIAS
jgi:beta-glucosidase